MIKTIKVKKHLRLDELIKYIFDNDIVGRRYEERADYKSYVVTNAVHVTGSGVMNIEGHFKSDTTFTVEVEKEITKKTPFEWLVGVNSYGSLERYEVATIADVLGDDSADCFAVRIYALLNEELELIWERE